MASKRIKELEKLIVKHKRLYYAGKAIISDQEYDNLEDELKKLDPTNKVLEIVGSKINNNEKVRHDKKMLSLNKSYSFDELIKWKAEHNVVSTFKIDGSSCSLVYENGTLVLAKTRGDGAFGENITQKVKYINTVPLSVEQDDKLEIRGEIYCTEDNFVHLSDEMVKRGLEKPNSLRNIVAGILGRKENVDLAMFLSFQAFDLIEEVPVKTEVEMFHKLQKLGFEIPEVELHKKNESIKAVIENAQNFMSEGEYLIDGLVFTYNEISLHKKLGETAHHPRYKMAFKFQGDAKETKLNSITWQISRNGIATPVGEVEPVELSGAMISRVTLHNYGIVRQHQLKAGDKIKIIRSGEVIPKFLEVVESSKKEFEIPTNCPSCNGKLFKEDIRLVCKNKKCPDQILDEILNFVRKVGIDDLSSSRLKEMINLGLVTDISSLYKLDKKSLLKMDKVKEKLANKILENINKTKEVDLVKFVSALGISGSAISKSEKIARGGYNTIEKFMKITKDELSGVESFAEKSATDFVTSLNGKVELVNNLLKTGIKVKPFVLNSKNILKDKKFCITGTLSRKRSEIENDIKNNGGQVVKSVTNNTDYLITNDTQSSSSKFKKAQELKIPIISEEKFLELIQR
jgi:DNA ligase (NAD+)